VEIDAAVGQEVSGPLKNSSTCRSRGHEALISSEIRPLCEPPHVGSCILTGLLRHLIKGGKLGAGGAGFRLGGIGLPGARRLGLL